MASRRKSIFEYNAQFHVFDLNGDEILSRDELKSVRRTLFLSLSSVTNVSKTDRPNRHFLHVVES